MDHIIGQTPSASPAAAATANTAGMIVDGDQKTFMQDVIEASRSIFNLSGTRSADRNCRSLAPASL